MMKNILLMYKLLDVKLHQMQQSLSKVKIVTENMQIIIFA